MRTVTCYAGVKQQNLSKINLFVSLSLFLVAGNSPVVKLESGQGSFHQLAVSAFNSLSFCLTLSLFPLLLVHKRSA